MLCSGGWWCIAGKHRRKKLASRGTSKSPWLFPNVLAVVFTIYIFLAVCSDGQVEKKFTCVTVNGSITLFVVIFFQHEPVLEFAVCFMALLCNYSESDNFLHFSGFIGHAEMC
jgi:hypothetical protein